MRAATVFFALGLGLADDRLDCGTLTSWEHPVRNSDCAMECKADGGIPPHCRQESCFEVVTTTDPSPATYEPDAVACQDDCQRRTDCVSFIWNKGTFGCTHFSREDFQLLVIEAAPTEGSAGSDWELVMGPSWCGAGSPAVTVTDPPPALVIEAVTLPMRRLGRKA